MNARSEHVVISPLVLRGDETDQLDTLTAACNQVGGILQALVNSINDADGHSMNPADMRSALWGARSLLDQAVHSAAD